MQTKEHWEAVYTRKRTTGVSWYQEHAERSLRFIRETGVAHTASIIDVGGGASTLVDDLLSDGYSALSVIDLSGAALSASRARLGERANAVRWIEGDILRAELAEQSFDVWHDRAVFHFLTSDAERQSYVKKVMQAVRPRGHVIVATFAENGPTECSGLSVMRYAPEELHEQFGASFSLLKQEREEHITPMGAIQKFIYCHCQLNPRS
jgi:SAM-dependent methyltransferase